MASKAWVFAAALTLLPAVSMAGDWTIRDEGDAMSDGAVKVAEVVEGRAFLMVRCLNDTPIVALGVPELVGRGDPIGRGFAPAYRVDAKPAAAFAWGHAQRGGQLTGDQATTFLRDISDGKSLLTRIITWDNQTLDNTFTLTGSQEAIRAALAPCS